MRPCPCEAGCVSCNYVVISHILGCPYNCSYCFLHTYYGKDEIVVYDNDDELLAQVSDCMEKVDQPLRIGTGQFSDSLALDRETGLSKKLIKLFAQQNKHLLELKTKSAEVDHLLDLDHKGRTVFAWSINPERVIQSEEFETVSLNDRVNAAQRCVAVGYRVGFHFDPIIYYVGWQDEYKQVVDLIFSEIKAKDIAWISLGALRHPPELKNKIACSTGEMVLGADGKMRYLESIRIDLFKTTHKYINFHSKNVSVYLCMEKEEIWAKVGVAIERLRDLVGGSVG
ncbi:hypothetical protein A3H38_03885 [candidate division WOR-1 bacterium RIFCSPLOWO2_02_FULL_46_20]|uniref:DNA photolyase n=1 Tax=candidate division WOR-1 bacterium RIFCSPLOWO2_02_FULL_46_20 TaxID=1802567 RepID=A0A1F4RFR2_UNCSA|nr:MAG: hypothetical protein A3H38_03885 [candidate division WOR-1 bacterium RIFCSPLOWO2_02_FULL_46_20]